MVSGTGKATGALDGMEDGARLLLGARQPGLDCLWMGREGERECGGRLEDAG